MDLGPFYTDVTAVVPDDPKCEEPWSPISAARRLTAIAGHLPIAVDRAQFVPSNNNDVWHVGEVYLRVAWRGDRSRLAREATVMDAVRDIVPVPEPLAVGGDESISWAISRSVPGRPLDHLCRPGSETRSGAPGREPFAELAGLLRQLHRWSPSSEIADLLTNRPGQDDTQPMAIVGSDAVPLPLARAHALIEPLKSISHVDHGVVDAAAGRLDDLADADHTNSARATGLIHGDVYLGNVLVDHGRVSGLLDFEFTRLGPPDLELISFIRAVDAERRLRIERPPVLEWLRCDYPELFSAPDLDRRLWLYALTYTLRQIIFWPPDRPEHDGLDPSHPVHTLRRLIDAPLPY